MSIIIIIMGMQNGPRFAAPLATMVTTLATHETRTSLLISTLCMAPARARSVQGYPPSVSPSPLSHSLPTFLLLLPSLSHIHY